MCFHVEYERGSPPCRTLIDGTDHSWILSSSLPDFGPSAPRRGGRSSRISRYIPGNSVECWPF